MSGFVLHRSPQFLIKPTKFNKSSVFGEHTINLLFNWYVPIGWQRSFLIILIVALTIQYFWRTPITNSGAIELSPPILPASFEGVDYGDIESAFADLRFENEFLVLDAKTESQFSIVLEQLPDGFENTHLDRMIFLAQQQFDGNQLHQIFSLLKKLADYKKQETAWWEKNSNASAADESVDKLSPLFDLQDQFLGKELARKLYHEQRRLMRYMTATLAIEKDESLSEKQRQDALEALANKLEQSQQGLQ